MRCLVRDPRRLGAQRVRVQIALGDLTDPPSFRNALRGVDTVVHLAASIRDQPRGSIEELNGIATWRMVQAAERAGVERFVFFSALDASTHHRARFFRAKALAEQAVGEADLRVDRVRAVDRLRARRPVADAARTPGAAAGDAGLRPRARAVPADLGRGRRRLRDGERCASQAQAARRAERGSTGHAGAGATSSPARRRSATPTSCAIVLRSLSRKRPLVHVPTPIVSRALRLLEASPGRARFATWDEAELMEVSMVSARGTADVEGLGVMPARMAAVLERRLARPEPRDRAAERRPTGARHSPTGARRWPTAAPLRAARRAPAAAPRRPGARSSCTPSGRPSSPSYSGSEIARLAGRVEDRRERREQARARERRHRVGRAGVERAERQRALRQRGREQRVVRRQERDEPAREAPAARTAARHAARACPSLRDHREDRPAHRLHVLGASARARRRARSRRSTARCGVEKTTPNSSDRPSSRHGGVDLLDLVAERAQQLGGVGDRARAHIGSTSPRARRQRRRPRSAACPARPRAAAANGSAGGGAQVASPGS